MRQGRILKETMHKPNSIEKRAWKFYDEWRKNPSYSPAFKVKVGVSRQGWLHISGAFGGKKRTFADITRRLKLLPKAKEIIETSTTIQDIEKKSSGRTFYALEAVVEIEEKGKIAPRKVRVILVEDKKGNKIFYSVMDRKSRRKNSR